MTSECWCVLSFDSRGVERWCKVGRDVHGSTPVYRDHEETACCQMVITLPSGYEFREPTCDGKEPERRVLPGPTVTSGDEIEAIRGRTGLRDGRPVAAQLITAECDREALLAALDEARDAGARVDSMMEAASREAGPVLLDRAIKAEAERDEARGDTGRLRTVTDAVGEWIGRLAEDGSEIMEIIPQDVFEAFDVLADADANAKPPAVHPSQQLFSATSPLTKWCEECRGYHKLPMCEATP